MNIDRHPVRFFVHCRPHVDHFLNMVSKWYDLVIFTASMEIYGSSVADKLDGGKGILQRRYFRYYSFYFHYNARSGHVLLILTSFLHGLLVICNSFTIAPCWKNFKSNIFIGSPFFK